MVVTWHRCRLLRVIFLLLLLAWGGAARGDDGKSAPWRYAVPADGEAFDHPPFHSVPLTAQKPDDLSEAAPYRGTKRLYAQLRYGSPGSTRVAVVVDETGPGEFDLYVDQNRDRRIEPAELVPGTGAVRRLTLAAQVVGKEGAVEPYSRTLVLRRGIAGKTLGVATCGYLEGEADLGGRRVKVRRVDGDGNGLFADGADRLWIDRDGDGRWDPVTEQFPYLPVLRVGEQRFAVRADAAGSRLAFEEIVGEGRLALHLPGLAARARVQQLQVMLVGEDGSAFTLQGSDGPATLPVGRYALGSVALSVLDSTSPEPWHFVFSRSDAERPQRWYDVRPQQEVRIDPLGPFRFELHAPAAARPGQELGVNLRLYTADGLLINSSGRGRADPFAASEQHNGATVQLLAPAGEVLSSAHSGFA